MVRRYLSANVKAADKMKTFDFIQYYQGEQNNPFKMNEADLAKFHIWNVERDFCKFANMRSTNKDLEDWKHKISDMIQNYFKQGFADSDNPPTEFLAMLFDRYQNAGISSDKSVLGFTDFCLDHYGLEAVIIIRQSGKTITFNRSQFYHGEDQNPFNDSASERRKHTLWEREAFFQTVTAAIERRALRHRSEFFKIIETEEKKQRLPEDEELSILQKDVRELIKPFASQIQSDEDLQAEAEKWVKQRRRNDEAADPNEDF